jgi:hypothetical protein
MGKYHYLRMARDYVSEYERELSATGDYGEKPATSLF